MQQGIEKPTNCVAMRSMRYPCGWFVAVYCARGYASLGQQFADKAGARRYAQWLAKRNNVRILEL